MIDKKLFSRAIKDKKRKLSRKPMLDKIEKEFNRSVDDLKARLIDKLFILVNGKTSQGVRIISMWTLFQREQIYPKNLAGYRFPEC